MIFTSIQTISTTDLFQSFLQPEHNRNVNKKNSRAGSTQMFMNLTAVPGI